MDQTQLELDLVAKDERCKAGTNGAEPAQVIDLQKVREKKQARNLSKIYESILESVEHLVQTGQRFK